LKRTFSAEALQLPAQTTFGFQIRLCNIILQTVCKAMITFIVYSVAHTANMCGIDAFNVTCKTCCREIYERNKSTLQIREHHYQSIWVYRLVNATRRVVYLSQPH